MLRRVTSLVAVAFAMLVLSPPAWAEPAFYATLDADRLDMPDEARRDLANQSRRWMWRNRAVRVSVEGAGQAYFAILNQRGAEPWETGPYLAIATPERRDVQGVLFIPDTDDGEHRVEFSIPADDMEQRADEAYYRIVADHYRRLVQQPRLQGRAWFRSRLHEAERMLGEDSRAPRTRPGFRGGAQQGELDEAFDLFSGTAAAGENLQLDVLLEPTEQQLLATVDLAEVEGITVDAIDWDDLIEDRQPAKDATAAVVPADQLAVFFADADALARSLAEFEEQGTRLLQWSVQAEDESTQQRYERQLGVSAAAIAELAPRLGVGSVAVTAGDAYFMAGTDVALLIAADQPAELHDALRQAQEQAAEQADEPVRSQEIGGVETSVVRTDDRVVSSYLARVDDVVVVSNSPVQLERVIAAAGDEPSLAESPDYVYFRGRYGLDEPETLLVVLSDEAIRRWGSPEVRVAASRRARMVAAMREAKARHLDEILSGDVQPRALDMRVAVPDSGELRLTAAGAVVSEVYGREDFLTPINELAVTHASEAEAEAYRRWRARYEGLWQQVFDPIALRMVIEDTQVAGDLTVLPLAAGSDYREMLELVGDATITAERPIYGNALAHFAMAIDVRSQPMMDLRNFARQGLAGVDNPFGWLGEMVGVYVDTSPFWAELAEAEDVEAFVEESGFAFPVAFYADVRDRVQLASFLTGLRTMVQSTAPGMVRWANRQHGEREYVAVISEEDAGAGGMAIYYGIHRGVLLLTLNEQTMQAFLETTSGEPDDEAASRPWLAEHVNFQISGDGLNVLQRVVAAEEDMFGAGFQAASWNYLPVLNDWRQHFPEHDPVEVYAHFHGTRPVDLFGGEFVWSEEDRTMVSTTAGHPGEPRVPETLPTPLRGIDFANFGLSFDAAHDALRARMRIERQAE